MRLTIIMLLLACTSQAAATNWHGRAHANPAIARAIERRTMAPAKPRVVMQRIEGGEVISVLKDGAVVREPLKRASTARIPEALGRVRIDRALTRIVAASKEAGDDNDKVAKKLEQLAGKIEKDNGKAKAAAAIGGALAATAAAYLAGRKGRTA